MPQSLHVHARALVVLCFTAITLLVLGALLARVEVKDFGSALAAWR